MGILVPPHPDDKLGLIEMLTRSRGSVTGFRLKCKLLGIGKDDLCEYGKYLQARRAVPWWRRWLYTLADWKKETRPYPSPEGNKKQTRRD